MVCLCLSFQITLWYKTVAVSEMLSLVLEVVLMKYDDEKFVQKLEYGGRKCEIHNLISSLKNKGSVIIEIIDCQNLTMAST